MKGSTASERDLCLSRTSEVAEDSTPGKRKVDSGEGLSYVSPKEI